MANIAKHETLSDRFANFATKAAGAAGHPAAFGIALASIVAWAACGPFFDYSESWQLLVNTGTTITTFLMVFIIQNSQNRDGLAAQIKLDEIIRAVGGASNTMIDLEDLSEKELQALREKFAAMAESARHGGKKPAKSNRRTPARKRRTGRRARS